MLQTFQENVKRKPKKKVIHTKNRKKNRWVKFEQVYEWESNKSKSHNDQIILF